MLTSQGVKIVLEPVEQVDRELFNQTIVILQNRLSNSTYHQSVVEADRVKQEISVMISKKQECYLSKITKFLTQTGELKFYIDGQAVLSAKEFKAVSVELNSEQGYFICFQLFPNEAKLLARVTQENIGKKMALYLDEDYLMSPVIRAAIESGMVGISLDRDIDKETAINMAALLRGGALPTKLRPRQK